MIRFSCNTCLIFSHQVSPPLIYQLSLLKDTLYMLECLATSAGKGHKLLTVFVSVLFASSVFIANNNLVRQNDMPKIEQFLKFFFPETMVKNEFLF